MGGAAKYGCSHGLSGLIALVRSIRGCKALEEENYFHGMCLRVSHEEICIITGNNFACVCECVPYGFPLGFPSDPGHWHRFGSGQKEAPKLCTGKRCVSLTKCSRNAKSSSCGESKNHIGIRWDDFRNPFLQNLPPRLYYGIIYYTKIILFSFKSN